MYICICKGITEKQIQDAVNTRKSSNAKDILKSLGVGTDCGVCVEDAVNALLEQQARSPLEMKDTSNNS